MSQQTIREQWFDGLAQAQSIACWLNCYLREFALPRGEVDVDYRGHDAPIGVTQHGGRLIRLRFAQAGYMLCVSVARMSQLGRCEYLSASYLKTPNEPWRCGNAQTTAHFLLDRLAPECGFNAELLAQSENSVAIMRELLGLAEGQKETGDTLIDAEQGMLWGHPMHPTPKSREGVDIEQVLACSPEAHTRFPLFWFRIDPRLLKTYGADMCPTLAMSAGAEGLYPCHPWEVDRLLANPVLQDACAQGWIEPMGQLGLEMLPTSSVRTMYHPELDYFLKLSIHVRLTNCVRKNAWYELESAVALTSILEPVWREIQRDVYGFEVLAEPAATTLDFTPFTADLEARRDLAESFGMLYRETVPAWQREHFQPQVAGTVFAADLRGISVCQQMVRDYAASQGRGYAYAMESWFESYASLLLDGVFLAFFRYGVILEPHLQNTVIGFDRGLPARVWVRDLEGTKLVEELWPDERLGELSSRARVSVHYSQELGWQRVAYCALVNNLAEAIFYLSGGDGISRQEMLEQRLWDVVGRVIERWQERFGIQTILSDLLAGEALPSKNNLRTRLFKRSDRDSDYTFLPSPICVQVNELAVA